MISLTWHSSPINSYKWNVEQGDATKWLASFYLTLDHYFNNSSATLHHLSLGQFPGLLIVDTTGKVHQVVAEGGMFNELLDCVKDIKYYQGDHY